MHSPEAIAEAKRLLKESRMQKQNRIRNYINSRDTNPYKGDQLAQLVDLYKKKDQQLTRTMDLLEQQIRPKDFTSTDLGMSYSDRQNFNRSSFAAENDVIAEKVGHIITSQELAKIKAQYGLSDITNRKLRDLIMLDDFYPKLIDTIKKFGPDIGETAINFLAPTVGTKLRSLYESVFQPSNETVSDMAKIAMPNTINGLKSLTKTKLAPNLVQETQSRVSGQDFIDPNAAYQENANKNDQFDGVAFDGLASMLCPEMYSFRVQDENPKKTALVTGNGLIDIITGSSGNVLLAINPLNPTAGTGAVIDTMFAASFPSWTPSTGATALTGETIIAGPLSTNTTNVRTGKVTSFSAEIILTSSSNNNSGSVHVAYIENETGFGLSATSNAFFTLANIANNAYYQTGNMNSRLRSLYIPDTLDKLASNTASNRFTDGFLIGIVGAATSSTVGVVKYSYVYEVQPTSSSLNIMPVENATPGPATVSAFNSAVSRNPAIQMLPRSIAARYAKIIFSKGSSLTYKQALHILDSIDFVADTTAMSLTAQEDVSDTSFVE
jgi:hypothetical protein